MEPGFVCEMLPQFLFRIGDLCRGHDAREDHQIGAGSVALRQAPPAHPELLAALGAGGKFDLHRAVQGGHGNLPTQHGFPRCQVQLVDQMMSVHLKIGMLGDPDAQVKVPRRAPVSPGFTPPGEAQFLSLGHPRRDLDLVGVRLDGASNRMTDIDFAHRAAKGLFQRYQNVAFNVIAALGRFPAHRTLRPPEAPRAAPGAPEHLLEEITETRAAKFKVRFRRGAPAAAERLPAESAVAGGRTKFRAGFPIGPELVEFLAFGGIAENLVGFVDFLELLLGFLLILGDIGVILPRKLAEGFFNLLAW